jgi:hypothetical protein
MKQWGIERNVRRKIRDSNGPTYEATQLAEVTAGK